MSLVEEIINSLPSDYSSVGCNSIKLQYNIEDQKWLELKEELKLTNKIGFGRGRGGTIHLLNEDQRTGAIIAAKKKKKKSKPKIDLDKKIKEKQSLYGCKCEGLNSSLTSKQIIERAEGCRKGSLKNPGYVCEVLVWLRKEKEKTERANG